ncbi:hypothetical protein WMW72_04630 [Paenibacillus filicis]|uniref:DUF6199 domain-containing protein n=1 Tax=Paenibacillus filicis TaxID=669464 RepID=A0ABU9DE79_9BACL
MMMPNASASKRNRASLILIRLGVVISIVVIAILAKSHFSQSVFDMNDHTYRQAEIQEGQVNYRSAAAPPIYVQIHDPNRDVIINEQRYSVYRDTSTGRETTFLVTYPDKQTYKVYEQSGSFLSYDENQGWVSELAMYSNNQRFRSLGDLDYFPSSLVIAAYPEYHDHPGNPVLFVLAFLLLIYGWCGYRYLKFQNFLFLISLRWVWVNDPEPSDFYYLMCKITGVLTMIGAVVLMLSSL